MEQAMNELESSWKLVEATDEEDVLSSTTESSNSSVCGDECRLEQVPGAPTVLKKLVSPVPRASAPGRPLDVHAGSKRTLYIITVSVVGTLLVEAVLWYYCLQEYFARMAAQRSSSKNTPFRYVDTVQQTGKYYIDFDKGIAMPISNPYEMLLGIYGNSTAAHSAWSKLCHGWNEQVAVQVAATWHRLIWTVQVLAQEVQRSQWWRPLAASAGQTFHTATSFMTNTTRTL